MSFVPIRSGYTGPSSKIGGSSPYHIDLKLSESVPIAERVRALDAIANQYRSIGREIEFSNSSVSGRRWNPASNISDKVQLLNQAAAAHGHSRHPGWQSLDFYVPFKGKSRFEKGAVEDASIYLPGVPGGTVRRGSGGGYGYYSEALDPSGRTLFRVGHGNVDRPESSGDITVGTAPEQLQLPPPGGSQQQAVNTETETVNKAVRDALVGSLLQQALLKRNEGMSQANPYAQAFLSQEMIDQFA